MRKFYSLLMGMLLMGTSAAMAQGEDGDATAPATISGYYRLTNPAFGDVLTVEGRHSIKAGEMTANNAGSVIQIETDKVWSFAEAMKKLDERLAAGEITEQQYTALFQQTMTVDSWKGGFYPVTSFRSQGVEYTTMIKKLADYCDDAIEAYLNDEIPGIYEKNWLRLLQLCAFAPDAINPSNISTVDTFRKWAENYLTRWRSVADFNLYLQPVLDIPEGEDGVPVPTGQYYLVFKTPVWVGSMKKAQQYLNNMIIDDEPVSEDDKLDLWGDSKTRILRAVAKDYPEGSAPYNFLHELLGKAEADMVYFLGETEEGGLYIQPLPDTFGTNGVAITADDLARCTWRFNKVDEEMPFAVKPVLKAGDAYYTTLCTDFPYEIKSAGAKAYFVESVASDGTFAETQELTKVPAGTPVVIKSQSADMKDNILVPLAEAVTPIEGSALEGTYFACDNSGQMKGLRLLDDGKASFTLLSGKVAANSAYYTGEVEGAVDAIQKVLSNTSNGNVYNLNGQRVQRVGTKGVYVVNGKKVIR